MQEVGHEGIVKSVTAETIEITINSQSACAGCHAKGACGMADMKEKSISLKQADFPIHAGDKVMVYASLRNAMFSVFTAYVIPVFVILISLFILLHWKQNEPLAAGGSIIAVACYFLILYSFRKKLDKKIKFSIKKME